MSFQPLPHNGTVGTRKSDAYGGHLFIVGKQRATQEKSTGESGQIHEKGMEKEMDMF